MKIILTKPALISILYILALFTEQSAQAGGYTPMPYLSKVNRTGELSCEIKGYAKTIEIDPENSGSVTSAIHTCLITQSLLFTDSGARFVIIEAYDYKPDQLRVFASYPKQINCTTWEKKDGEGWRLFSKKPHSNWFNKRTLSSFGTKPVQVGEWWWLKNYNRNTYDWEQMEPPIGSVYKIICKEWHKKKVSSTIY